MKINYQALSSKDYSMINEEYPLLDNYKRLTIEE